MDQKMKKIWFMGNKNTSLLVLGLDLGIWGEMCEKIAPFQVSIHTGSKVSFSVKWHASHPMGTLIPTNPLHNHKICDEPHPKLAPTSLHGGGLNVATERQMSPLRPPDAAVAGISLKKSTVPMGGWFDFPWVAV